MISKGARGSFGIRESYPDIDVRTYILTKERLQLSLNLENTTHMIYFLVKSFFYILDEVLR